MQFAGLQILVALHRTLHAQPIATVHADHDLDASVDHSDHGALLGAQSISSQGSGLELAWRDHKSKIDCDRFDACASGDAWLVTIAPQRFIAPDDHPVTRTYSAQITASTRFALARAPPHGKAA